MADRVQPLFSILHPSARPQKWREIFSEWILAADKPGQVEYVLCADERWGFLPDSMVAPLLRSVDKLVWNTGRRCYVDSVNKAALNSWGKILIVIADDQYPCEHWDTKLFAAIAECERTGRFPPLVVRVSTGTPNEHDRHIMVMPILSRDRYERFGYVFYPEYESMFADADFCEHAEQDGVIIDARELLFPHRHPLFCADVRKPGVPWQKTDAVYEAQMRDEAWDLGAALIASRRQLKFANDALLLPQLSPPPPPKPTIALCLSGDHFQGAWVDGILDLQAHLLQKDYAVYRMREYTSNVYVTRENLRQALMTLDPRPDLVLWLDDDNILTPAQLDRLIEDLEGHPEADGVTGWCWIHDEQGQRFMVSCGVWAADHVHWEPFDSRTFPNSADLRTAEVTGFPAFLMRYSAITKAGERPFLPILDQSLPQGISGEDLAFCRSAEVGGACFLADPHVRVPHLKYVEMVPVFGDQGAADLPKVAVMMRVKNESRWIQRAIESVKELAGDRIFVMDDGSEDNTAGIARVLGARVIESPFRGQPLDEGRDKTWLLRHVKAECNPDWVLFIDGDEELEPGGADKIWRAIASNPPVDCFNLRFLYLWNSLDTIRWDGVYSSLTRQSLFRASAGTEFKSYYGGTHSGLTTNEGLHTSNAPHGLRSAPLQVSLLHYGYLFKEDRIRKYQWYNRIDPTNEIEDGYRHIAQGDLPEIPASMRLKFAGPLELRKLPPHMVPHFQVMPGPRIIDITPLPDKYVHYRLDGAAYEMDQPELLESRIGVVPPVELPRRINLGCSDRLSLGWWNVDLFPPADEVADLTKPWPWPDNSVDEIRAWDIVEHLPDRNHTMNEAFRVLKPGGILNILVPTTDGRGAYQDPGHVSFWNRNTFFYYEAGNPHLTRFAPNNGVKCAFRVVSEHTERLPDEVVKLQILLEAVKPAAVETAAAD